MKKRKLKLKVLKPRNPLVVIVMQKVVRKHKSKRRLDRKLDDILNELI